MNVGYVHVCCFVVVENRIYWLVLAYPIINVSLPRKFSIYWLSDHQRLRIYSGTRNWLGESAGGSMSCDGRKFVRFKQKE
jgi:hypothetical protein